MLDHQATDGNPPDRIPSSYGTLEPTIEGLFEGVDRVIDHARILTYDETYGFPSSLATEGAPSDTDAEWYFFVQCFSVPPEPECTLELVDSADSGTD